MDQSYLYIDLPSLTNSPMLSYRKDAKKGTKFTFMVCGEQGLGKSTFINCLLDKNVKSHRYSPSSSTTLSFTSTHNALQTSLFEEFDPISAADEPGIALTETSLEILTDDNQKLILLIIDTPGFGDNFNNSLCFTEIENYLKQQFDLVLAEETRIKRNPRFIDTRVHALLYFITPTGHGLREIDINCMKRLSKYVNILPIIAKSDTFTPSELSSFKSQINLDLKNFNVPTFQFDSYLDEYDQDDDADLIQEFKFLASKTPFAIITSENSYEINGKLIKGREYPWGFVDISDPKISDFIILKNVLLSSHLQDLKDLTHDFLYETYRTERLSNVTNNEEFQDSIDHKTYSEMPSMSNLAQIASNSDSKNDLSIKDKDDESFDDSYYSPNLNGVSNSAAFKRMSIAPQRHQLRQISETVPYVIRHERILERQQKLEEMEMASAKELANRAAALEAKAAELKLKEKNLLKRLDLEKSRKSSQQDKVEVNYEKDYQQENYEKDYQQENNEKNYEGDYDGKQYQEGEYQQNKEQTYEEGYRQGFQGIPKDETLTDLHSVVRS